MITEHGLQQMGTAIFGLMHEVLVRFDDLSTMTVPIHKHELTEDTLKIIGLLSNQIQGNVISIEVIDAEGHALLNKDPRYTKTELYGLLIIFQSRFVEADQ